MSNVETIYIRFKTADIIDAGTDLEVYVGIGGREFYIESQRDFDYFERGDDRTYIIGDIPRHPSQKFRIYWCWRLESLPNQN